MNEILVIGQHLTGACPDLSGHYHGGLIVTTPRGALGFGYA
jgi:hypothetical protein